MANEQAAKRYAQAALDIALETGAIAEWRATLADIATVFTDSGAAAYFADSRVPLSERTEAVGRVLDLPTVGLNFAKVLLSKGRSQLARTVEQAFTRLADAHEGIVLASLTTAIDLPPAQVAQIEGQLSTALDRRVRMTALVDPAIIGGIVIRVGDQLVDGSVRSRLKRLRTELAGAR